MSRSGWAPVAALLVVVVTGCEGGSGGGDGGPQPGSETGSGAGGVGVGDPYFPTAGNGGYQVGHYDLRVTYDPASKELTGSATITASATQDLSRFSLDLSGLEVREVEVDGAAATTGRGEGEVAGEKLVITPARGLPEGSEFTVDIEYGGVPEPVQSRQLGSNGFHHTDDGAFVAGQPRSASTWFPVNEHPVDKATYDIEVTVPEGLAALSNGVPTGTTTSDGWTTWGWAERVPMASYLSTVVIGDYRVHEEEHGGKPMVTAVHTSLPTDVDDQLRLTGEIADGLAEWFGPYPFDSYGGIALADQRVGFALETQSRPVYGPGFFSGGQDATWVIVHELAHQWYGNSVSVRDWSQMWLNEGFATYAEWLWEEWEGGDNAQEAFDLHWNGPGEEDGFWSPPSGDPGAAQLFGSVVYVRGAMALHAIRLAVGDDDFFEILRAWAHEQRNANVTTDQLLALCERVSGQPLDAVFDEWLHSTDRPEYPGA